MYIVVCLSCGKSDHEQKFQKQGCHSCNRRSPTELQYVASFTIWTCNIFEATYAGKMGSDDVGVDLQAEMNSGCTYLAKKSYLFFVEENWCRDVYDSLAVFIMIRFVY